MEAQVLITTISCLLQDVTEEEEGKGQTWSDLLHCRLKVKEPLQELQVLETCVFGVVIY